MPATFPQSAREAWGERVADDVARWFDESIREQAVPRDEYREVLSRLDVVEERLGHLGEGLADVKGELRAHRRETNERFDRMNERFDRMHEAMRVQTRWTVGTIALFGTIVTVLLAVAEFVA